MVTMFEIGATKRWSMLALGAFAQTSSAIFVHGIPFLLPTLTDRGLSLTAAGFLVSMPTVGLVCTLIAWGWVVDRIGERKVLIAGPVVILLAGIAASAVTNYAVLGVLFLLGGMGAASTNGASGRVIVGWFPPDQRGLALGIRQTAQPLGVGFGALTIPMIAAAQGFSAAIMLPALMAGTAAVACAFGIADPPRPVHDDPQSHSTSPYRADSTLWRIHSVSTLLVVPQFTLWTFALLWLHRDVGWSLAVAGATVTFTQFLGAVGRIGVGVWSDQVGSRLRPLRSVAIAATIAMVSLALAAWAQWWWVAVAAMVIASVITVSDNGLAFTAVAEIAGPYWSGRSLGIHNTGQNLAGSAVAPLLGSLITVAGFPATFLTVAFLAAAAIPLVPAEPIR